MNIGFLITARLKSTRLPKKVMLPLNGYTVIERVIQRAKKVVKPGKVVLCTSNYHQDLPLIETAVRNNIYYFNGHPDDVLQRLTDASDLFGFDFFIGITADNPLFSINHAIQIIKIVKQDNSLDYIYTSGMPIGANIYGINFKALKTVCAVKEQTDTEIWGYLINRPEIFKIKEIKAESKYIRPHYRLTLDEIEDYRLIKTVYNNFEKDSVVSVLESYDFLDRNPDIATMNRDVIQIDLDDSVKKKIDKFFITNKEDILRIKKELYNASQKY